MNDSKQRVLEMVANGDVSAAEGDELLDAMSGPAPAKWKQLLNPFPSLHTAAGLSIGGLLAGISLFLSTFGVRFDGALDVHLVPDAPSWPLAVLDQLVAWPLVAALMWGAARILRTRTRFADFLSVVGFARLPLVLLGLAVCIMVPDPGALMEAALRGEAPPVLLMIVLLTLLAVGWFLAWLFVGYRTASGLRGSRGAFTFIAVVVSAEILSKGVLVALSGVLE